MKKTKKANAVKTVGVHVTTEDDDVLLKLVIKCMMWKSYFISFS